MEKSVRNLALLSLIGVAAFSSCSSDDLYQGDQTVKEYEENFKNTFGNIDPEQDWSMATRGSVTVSVPKTSDVKIYTKNSNGVYGVVGNFQKVSGTQTLEFDVAKGTGEVLVSTSQKGVIAKLGEIVDLGATATKTRTMLVENSETFSVASDYTTFSSAVVQSYTSAVPEETDNLGEVTQNFSFVSTGPFTIYPVFWQTNSYNSLGVYWTDSEGKYNEQELYLSRKGDEVMIKSGGSAAYDEEKEYSDGKTHQVGDEVTANGQTYTISKVVDNGIQYFECSDDHTDLKVGSTCSQGHVIAKIEKQDEKCWNHSSGYEVGDVCPCGINITSVEYEQVACWDCGWKDSQTINVGEVCGNGHTVSYVDEHVHYYNTGKEIYYGYRLKYYYEKEDIHYYYIVHHDAVEGSWTSNIYSNTTGSGDIKSKGITINLPEGTHFGLYIKVYESEDLGNDGLPKNGSSQYSFKRYSEASKNKAQAGQNPQADYDQNSKKDGTDASYCFASYFNTTVDGNNYTFLGFEDWATSITDLNDILFVFGGTTTPTVDDKDNPTIPPVIDEDDDSQSSWIIACEDLGNTDDYDFNDIVLKITHVSGENDAYMTPLAAGGTLATDVYFGNKNLGEIHGLISSAYANTNDNGYYTMLNTDGGSNPGPGARKTLAGVGGNFSLAPSDGESNFGGISLVVHQANDEIGEVETINENKRISAPEKGAVPQMFVVDGSWKWPKERRRIEDAYPSFGDWVGNASNTTWKTNKNDANIYQGN